MVTKLATIKETLLKKMEILIFVANLIAKVNNIYFTPEDLLQISEGLYLINFDISTISSQKLFIAFMRWCFEEYIDFNQCLEDDYRVPLEMPKPIQ